MAGKDKVVIISTKKAPTGYRKKPLGEWPEDKKHGEVQTPQNIGESSESGHMPDPESDDDIDQMASEMGLYEETSPTASSENPENPQEVNIAEEIEEAEKSRFGS